MRLYRPLPLLALLLAACSSDGGSTTPAVDAGDTTRDVAGGGSDAAGDAPTDAAADVAPDAPATPVEITVLDDVRISSWDSDENFQNARGEVDWGQGPFADVRLVVELSSTCYPFDWVRTGDGVPAGHNWPESCDAFDRNFEITLNDPEAEGEPPAIELVRAITPFGGPMRIEADITDIANARPGANRLRVHITTWSDGAGQVSGAHGGWNVSARVITTAGPAPRNVLAVVPLLNVFHGALEDWPEIPFTVPEGTVEGRIEYRTTGHGGGASDDACIGPADEFCRRYHHVYLDGRDQGVWQPWRDDCDTLCTLVRSPFEHCEENPCGSIGSVRAPRANWCPGDVTPPEVFEGSVLAEPGEHTFSYLIEDVGEGGSWRTSAVYYAYGE